MTLSNNSGGPGPAQERILRDAIYPLHFLTLEQVGRFMGYKKTAYNGVGRHLLGMIDKDKETGEETENGYLARFKLPTGLGMSPYVYMLGRQGREYFKELHWDAPNLPKFSIMKTRSYSFLSHLLEVNNVIIAAKVLQTHNPNIYLIRFEHDVLLKKNPIVAKQANHGIEVSIAPDAIVEIEADGRWVLWIEVERGTNNDKYLLEKMNAIYDVFKLQIFQDRVNTRRCRVCYMTTAGHEDVERLRRLARAVLSERLGNTAPSHKHNLIFNFIEIPAMIEDDIDVTHTFLQSSWLRAFHLEYFPILKLKE